MDILSTVKLKFFHFVLVIVGGFCLINSVSAASIHSDAGTITILDGSISSVFEITASGTYSAGLTYGFDLNYPGTADVVGISVIDSAANVLGSLDGVGSFSFDAQPGTYYLNVYAVPNQLFLSANYTATVSAVPLPASLLLFGSSLVALVGLKRRGRVS